MSETVEVNPQETLNQTAVGAPNVAVDAPKAARTVEEINKDYNTECARLGDLIFKAAQLQAKQQAQSNQVEEKLKIIATLANEAKAVQK